MKANLNSDLVVRNLTPESGQYYCMSGNSAEKGFGVLVYPSGSKTFIYRYKVDGAQRLLTFGEYPATTLKDAREMYQKAAMQVRDLRRGSKDGADPVDEIKREKERRIVEAHERKKAPTVKELVEDYLTTHAKAEKRNWQEDERILTKEVVSRWGRLKAASIQRKDIISMVDEITLRSASSAAQTLKITRKMFNWAFEKERVPATPCTGVKARKDNERTRALTDKEILAVWRKLDDMPLTGEMQRALKLILVTAQRPGEVVGMHTKEMDGHWWTIPAERSKNGRAHRVYLTDTALEIINAATEDAKQGLIRHNLRLQKEGKPEVAITDPYSGHIFPCPHKEKNKAIEGHALPVAVRRCLAWPLKDKRGKPLFGADGKPATENLLGVDPWTPHDLRRTATTLMAAIKIPLEHRERVLNHSLGKLDRIYNLHDYDDEKQIALEALERKILTIINSSEGKVIPITADKKAA
ncbi:MAG: site-specific integrase [Oryzomonas sp.]|uniref:tyrosine-type recombinase/integrase n=1 Tax=Oryzomonas sp. TaxID=2855186 RepID=UPI0028500DBF|nr:site-specific integrase [Oryzomonas sp.]MDR3581587.1 site-specific integrase [Oryzomonas sp.]